MWIAIQLPQLPLEIFLRSSSTPEPFAIEERHCVAACDRKAAARGVSAGMAVSAALAFAPRLRIMARDLAAETEALLGVAGWAAQFTPAVAIEFPDAVVLLEVSGSLKLFHGLDSLLESLRRGIDAMGYSATLAGAPTPRAASWLACAGEQKFVLDEAGIGQALDALPVAALRCGDEMLAALQTIGVRTLGELRALPRAGVARRFGQAPLDDLDRAFGRLPDPRNFFVPPAKFSAGLELPAEVTQTEALLFAVKRLIVQLAGFLAARSGGVQRFALKLAHRDSAATEVVIGLVAPSRDTGHFTLLLRERLDGLALREPVRRITLEADDVVPLPGRNLGLLPEEGGASGDWERLVERLRSRLGAAAVHGLATCAEHRPERAFAASDPGTKKPSRPDFGPLIPSPSPAWSGRREQTAPLSTPWRGDGGEVRPFWLLDAPKPLREAGTAPDYQGPLELLAGPERIESGWWDGDDIARDYFIARTRSESLVWIYRERRGEGGWYLHGVFA